MTHFQPPSPSLCPFSRCQTPEHVFESLSSLFARFKPFPLSLTQFCPFRALPTRFTRPEPLSTVCGLYDAFPSSQTHFRVITLPTPISEPFDVFSSPTARFHALATPRTIFRTSGRIPVDSPPIHNSHCPFPTLCTHFSPISTIFDLFQSIFHCLDHFFTIFEPYFVH